MKINKQKIYNKIARQGMTIPAFYKQLGWSRQRWYEFFNTPITFRKLEFIGKKLGIKANELIIWD